MRLRELDFLRGVAILLVLLRHQKLFDFTTKMGWVGVDLFFVLSGFLVSGLLFKEYLRFGNIKPGTFLIRRGFKIYPIYYLTYILYLFLKIVVGKFSIVGFLSDMFFVQNYVLGWGYSYSPSWSLAVEEHFYFTFAFLIYFGIKSRLFKFQILPDKAKITTFEIFLLSSFIICLFLRYFQNIYYPENVIKHITMTHLRIDSLFAGVLVSYLYYFRKTSMTTLFNKYKSLLLLLSFLLVSFTPFLEFTKSFFVRTLGFTFLLISFSILLSYFLLETGINSKLDQIFSKIVVDFITKIGFASYSIYVIHTFCNSFVSRVTDYFDITLHPVFMFLATSLVSILTGMLMTEYLETYFLKIRDRYFPSRVSVKI